MNKIKSLLLSSIVLLTYSAHANNVQTLADKVSNLNKGHQDIYTKSAKLLRCAACTGLSVLESDAPFSLQIRNKVADLSKKGMKENEIIDFFTSRYGIWILRKPPFSGAHAFAWLIPLIIMLFGILFIWFLFWRKKKNGFHRLSEFYRQRAAGQVGLIVTGGISPNRSVIYKILFCN